MSLCRSEKFFDENAKKENIGEGEKKRKEKRKIGRKCDLVQNMFLI